MNHLPSTTPVTKTPTLRPTRLALAACLGCALAWPMAAHAADDTPAPAQPYTPRAVPTVTPQMTMSDRDRMDAMRAEQRALAKALTTGRDATFYRNKLEGMGYTITAINEREPDYLEYEVVKGSNTHEIQIERNARSGLASAVSVEANLWRADSTQAALRGEQVEPARSADYSDRAYVGEWTDERKSIETALEAGHDRQHYVDRLEQMGYDITARNEITPEYAEYEIVKGRRSYEVQLEFDGGSSLATDVDVTANLWQAPSTEKAVEAAEARIEGR